MLKEPLWKVGNVFVLLVLILILMEHAQREQANNVLQLTVVSVS